MTKKYIQGAGGNPSPPQPPQPTRTPDTLHSRQFATFLDLVSEGEIEGFATASKEGLTKGTTAYNNAALKDVFLNNTAVLKSTASSSSPNATDFNFQNVGFTPRFGTANQTHIPGIESSESTTAVGVVVTNASPVTRTITNTSVDAIKVSITLPQLQRATDAGDLLGSSVQFKISVQYNSGGFTDVITDTITGRTADAYQKDYRVDITGAFPVDIRITRITADSTSSSLVDAFQWSSFSEIIDDKQTYANSAYLSLRIDSQQFSSIPSRKYRLRGVKVRIPGAGANSSGTPTVDNATGRIVYPTGYIFNGVMGAATYCNCPSMVLLDLLTNTRYGLGSHLSESDLDKFSFYQASVYCSQQVDDGTGTGNTEPRFSCNVCINSQGEAYNVVNQMCSVFRSMPFWSAGSLTITQDAPKDSSYLFSLSNVLEPGFSYSNASQKTRPTVVIAKYLDLELRDINYVEQIDTANQARYGSVIKNIDAFACTSRGQASRLARWVRFSEQNLTETVTFTVDLGAGPEIEGVAEKAKKAGAIDSVILDVKDEFVNEYVFPGLKAGAMYEDVYALSTAFARPLMSKKIVFMGTPEFAVPTLEALKNSNNEITVVYSQPASKANRGQKLLDSKVGSLAKKFSLSLYEISLL